MANWLLHTKCHSRHFIYVYLLNPHDNLIGVCGFIPFYSWETSQGFGKKVNIEKFDDGRYGKRI